MPIMILGTGNAERTVTLTLRAATEAPQVTRLVSLTLRARTGRQGEAADNAPTVVMQGHSPLRTTATLTLNGRELRGLSWQHTRHYEHIEAEFTVLGLVRPQRGDFLGVEVQQKLPSGKQNRVVYEVVPATGDYEISQTPSGQVQTVFRGRTTQDALLQNHRLPELIAWNFSPTRQIESPWYRSMDRQVAAVNEVLSLAFQEAGQLVSNLIALQGEFWEETRREYSTLDRTPMDVFNDTYGRLGARMLMTPLGSKSGRWDVLLPGELVSFAALDQRLLTGQREQAEYTHQPRSVTVKIGDKFTAVEDYLQNVVESGRLPDVLGEDGEPVQVDVQDKPAATFEVNPNAVLTGWVDRDGRRTARYVRKANGRVVQVIEVSVGRVEAPRFTDEELAAVVEEFKQTNFYVGQTYRNPVRVYDNAVLDLTRTTFTYLPGSTDSQALAESISVHTSFTYTWDGSTTAVDLPEELQALVNSPRGGFLLGQEATRIRNVWSPQGGFLRERLTVESRVGDVGQEGLSDPTKPPPPPKTLTVDEFHTTETYAPTGGGYWLYTRRRVGPAKLPVKDMEAGEFVKTERRIGLLEHSAEITENAPPTIRDEVPPVENQAAGTTASTGADGDGGTGGGTGSGLPWPKITYIRDPQEATVTNLDGPAQPVAAELGAGRDQRRAQKFAEILNRSYLPRTRYFVTTPEAAALKPGTALQGFGIIDLVSARGTANTHTLELEVVAHHAR